MIGILEKDKTAVRKFSRGNAIRKYAFVISVGRALPTSDIDNAERTSGKSSDAARDATKDRKQRTQHPNHGNSPAYYPQRNAITGCIAANNGEAALCLNE